MLHQVQAARVASIAQAKKLGIVFLLWTLVIHWCRAICQCSCSERRHWEKLSLSTNKSSQGTREHVWRCPTRPFADLVSTKQSPWSSSAMAQSRIQGTLHSQSLTCRVQNDHRVPFCLCVKTMSLIDRLLEPNGSTLFTCGPKSTEVYSASTY